MVTKAISKWSFTSNTKTHVGKVRSCNEDAVLDLNQDRVWVVADGMGGHSAGDIASQIVVDSINSAVMRQETIGVELLTQALQAANREVYDYSQQNLGGQVMGAAVVVLYIEDGTFHCLWAGDCRAYLYRKGALIQQTRDHSQVAQMVDDGLISQEEAEHHPLSNVITRAVGVDPHLDVDVLSNAMEPGDQFLLCSDGLTNELSPEEILLALRAKTVTSSSMALLHSALVKGAKDNVSVSLIKANPHPSTDLSHLDDLTVPVFYNARGV